VYDITNIRRAVAAIHVLDIAEARLLELVFGSRQSQFSDIRYSVAVISLEI